MKPKIYFDIESEEFWARKEWQSLFAAISNLDSRYRITEDRKGADFVVTTQAPSTISKISKIVDGLQASSSDFVWDASDFPTGISRGLHCSLKRALYDPSRHRSFVYPIVYNEVVDYFDKDDARYDWGFFGGITSPLRRRIVDVLAPLAVKTNGLIEVRSGPWNRMFDRSGISEKVEYAEALRLSRFFVCPRGNGVGSIRLFETMKAGRVPIIISDSYVLPAGVDWSSCSVQVAENDIRTLPDKIRSNLDCWPRLADAARREWVKRFSNDVLLDEIGDALTALSKGSTRARPLPVLSEWVIQRSKLVVIKAGSAGRRLFP